MRPDLVFGLSNWLMSGDTSAFGFVHSTGTVLPLVGRYAGIVRSTWDVGEPGVMCLPSGRLLRGRGLHQPLPKGATPDFALYLLGQRPAPVEWQARWVPWSDFRLPRDRGNARDALREAWLRSENERVEIGCDGGHGRTGTALACIAVLDGVPADKAVKFVREHYNPRAVETPWQRRYVSHFTAD